VFSNEQLACFVDIVGRFVMVANLVDLSQFLITLSPFRRHTWCLLATLWRDERIF
jgi:hypothetical protein